ncbi:unnamed protein product, partial [Meganyctiphanes norvegica]
MYIETLNLVRYDAAGGVNKSNSLHDVSKWPPFFQHLQPMATVQSPLAGVGGPTRGGHYHWYRYRSNKHGPTMASAPALDQRQPQTLPKAPHFLPLMSPGVSGSKQGHRELVSGLQSRRSSRASTDSAFLPRITNANLERTDSVRSSQKSKSSPINKENDMIKNKSKPIKSIKERKRSASLTGQNDRATIKTRKGNSPTLRKSSSTTDVSPFSFDTPLNPNRTRASRELRNRNTPNIKNAKDSNFSRSRKKSGSLQTLNQITSNSPHPKRRTTRRRRSSLPPSRAAKTPVLEKRSTKSRRGSRTTSISTPLPRASRMGHTPAKMPDKSGVDAHGDDNDYDGEWMSMGKTTTTTEKKTYTKDGKVFEDEIVTTVVEDDEGTKTTKKTTTRHLGDADSFDFSKVKKSLPEDKKSGKSRKSRSRSSSSSSDSDDGKKSKSKPEKSHSGGAKGLLGKLKSKAHRSHSSSDSDSSDDEDFAESAHKEINAIRKKHCVDKLKLNKE